MEYKVSVLRRDEYDADRLYEDVCIHLERLGGVESYITPGMRVLIKPNLIMAGDPARAATTHPAVVDAVVRAVTEAGASAVIADTPGGMLSDGILKRCYDQCGMRAVADKYGAELGFGDSYRRLDYPEGVMCKSFNLIEHYFECDAVISVSKLKTHSITAFTGAAKNMFGLIPGLQKSELHFRFTGRDSFCEMLTDLALAVGPVLSFMDGIVGMEGNGPTGGKPRHAGVTLASASPFALDLLASSLVGFLPVEVGIVKQAGERGAGPKDLSDVELIGEDFFDIAVYDFVRPDTHPPSFARVLPNILRGPAEKLASPKPRIDRAKCIGCGKCAESCPAKVITIEGGKAVIDMKGCIRCFCCHEMCPVQAVDIRRLKLFDR